MSKTESRYRCYISYLNDRRIDELDDFVHEELTYNGKPMTRLDYQDLISGDIAAIPGLYFDIQTLITADDQVACRIRFDCTLQGEFLGLRPNGKPSRFASMSSTGSAVARSARCGR